MGRERRAGVCKLTGTVDQFVDSHIIPAALTRLGRAGEKRLEAGIGLGKKRRANSYYDGALVTRQGGDILARIDSAAIEELRGHHLVWSGWGPVMRLRADDVVSNNEGPSHRLIPFEHPTALQLFFLSLLRRAAASSRPEFNAHGQIDISERSDRWRSAGTYGCENRAEAKSLVRSDLLAPAPRAIPLIRNIRSFTSEAPPVTHRGCPAR